MNEQQPSNIDKFSNWVKHSVTLRLFTIGFLILIMLIPLSYIKSLISEREVRKFEVEREVGSTWGNAQTITGPILTVPFSEEKYVYDNSGNYEKNYINRYVHFLPEELKITGNLLPEIRNRGIYNVMVYSADLKIEGSFNRLDFTDLNIGSNRPMLEKSFISVGLSDLRGISENVMLELNENKINFDPGIETNDITNSGMTAKIVIDKNDSTKLNFSFDLKFNGSSSINFIPAGKKTTVNISSINPNPSFFGAFLPDKRNISEKGFNAEWKVFHLNRTFPQKFIDERTDIITSSFGVKLLVDIDEYHKNTRAVKYAVLFIILTFMTFFFVQTINKIRIHPIQYLLTGLALSIFFVLLISISEHLNFMYAYLIASISIISLIVMYIKGIFKSNKLTLFTALLLIILYGFIYIIIQLQDFALLIGSIGLFVVLAATMLVSRKIDWYSLKTKKD